MRKGYKLIVMALVSVLCFSLTSCEKARYDHDNSDTWKTKFDLTLPDLADAGSNQDSANKDGWYQTLFDDFNDGLGPNWDNVENQKRKDEYWCEDFISVKDGLVHIDAVKLDNHNCDKCGGKSGMFTSGIITCDTSDGGRKPIFEQAYGYYECRVKIPNSPGMWSAFWLQTGTTTKLGNEGKDGSEIDIYESVFINDKTKVANNVIYDGYGKKTRSMGKIADVGVNTYEGYHTYALKWTPTEYVFYFDGKPTWATDFGGVCQVPAYLMLTNEIRKKGTNGPHGEIIQEFVGDEFLIDYVKVYQNTSYLEHIKKPSDF